MFRTFLHCMYFSRLQIDHKCPKIRSLIIIEKGMFTKREKGRKLTPRFLWRYRSVSYFIDRPRPSKKNQNSEKGKEQFHSQLDRSIVDFSTYNASIIAVVMVQKGGIPVPTVRLTQPSCHLAVTCIVAQVILRAGYTLAKIPGRYEILGRITHASTPTVRSPSIQIDMLRGRKFVRRRRDTNDRKRVAFRKEWSRFDPTVYAHPHRIDSDFSGSPFSFSVEKLHPPMDISPTVSQVESGRTHKRYGCLNGRLHKRLRVRLVGGSSLTWKGLRRSFIADASWSWRIDLLCVPSDSGFLYSP